MLVTNFRFKYFVYRVVQGLYQALDVATMHPVRERARLALQDTVAYIETAMPNALGFDTQLETLVYALQQTTVPGHYMEFGVFQGGTIRFIAKRLKGGMIHGFDSFEGLPEAWAGWNLGRSAFSTGGKLPRVPRNVALHRGYFEDSLPPWLARNPGPVAFMHIDCDLYSSTKTIFRLLANRLQPGTIILFDEYFNYSNWRQHEYKAFQEFVSEHHITYEYLAFARQQVAVRIVGIGGRASP